MTRLLPLLILLAPGVAPAAGPDCGDAQELRRLAGEGKLDDAQIDCLEGAWATVDQLDRFEISELLLADGAAKNDLQGWTRRAARHLDELDPKDAALALQYAKTLMSNPARATESVHWAEVALAHPDRLPEDSVGIKLYEAHRVRTRASKVIWDTTVAALEVDPENTSKIEAAATRSRVRLHAVEWMKHAVSIDMSPDEARAFCAQTGWTEADCDEAAAR